MKNLGVILLLAAGGYLVYRYMNPQQQPATTAALLPPPVQTANPFYNAAEPAPVVVQPAAPVTVAPAPVIVKPTPPIIPIQSTPVKVPPVAIYNATPQTVYNQAPINTDPVKQPVASSGGVVPQVSPLIRHVINCSGCRKYGCWAAANIDVRIRGR